MMTFMEAYAVPQHDAVQLTLFDVGDPTATNKRPTAAQLERRLAALLQVKLEIEEQNDSRLLAIKYYKEELEKANNVLYRKGGVHKELYQSRQQNNRLRLRMKELIARMKQITDDHSRMQNTVDKLRTEYKCIKCGEVRHYKAFAKDPSKITGREQRCNLCQRAKTESWRAAKKLLMGT